jgi:hypothetical protein
VASPALIAGVATVRVDVVVAGQHLRWRRRAEHPPNDPFTARACRAAVRSAEALVAQYAATPGR